ncbi:MAG: Fic family protein [Acidobacteriaceae bacterium]
MEPLFPGNVGPLKDLAFDLTKRASSLGAKLHPITHRAIAELLRITNSYYSNLIEGYGTRPIDIERAMRNGFSKNTRTRALQELSLAHIKVQHLVEKRLTTEPELSPSSGDFLLWLHKELYKRLPEEFLKVKSDRGDRELGVKPGEWRNDEVAVGEHVAPAHAAIPNFINRFETFYKLDRFHGDEQLIAVAAMHHRFVWIHPFIDGNGRVARLMTDAALMRILGAGYGIWTASRGFARSTPDHVSYKEALSIADSPREGDLDGRGNLSEKGLAGFCRYFLETCLDQINYMANLVEPDRLIERLEGYVQLRAAKALPKPDGKPGALKVEAAHLLREVALRGEVPRGEASRIMGLSERTARDVLSTMISEGLLVSDSPKKPVRLSIPIGVTSIWFPNLYPSVDALTTTGP